MGTIKTILSQHNVNNVRKTTQNFLYINNHNASAVEWKFQKVENKYFYSIKCDDGDDDDDIINLVQIYQIIFNYIHSV